MQQQQQQQQQQQPLLRLLLQILRNRRSQALISSCSLVLQKPLALVGEEQQQQQQEADDSSSSTSTSTSISSSSSSSSTSISSSSSSSSRSSRRMAKGLRCKTKRAFRAVKRQHVSATVEASRMEALQQKLKMVQQGSDPMCLQRRHLNRFLHPEAAAAAAAAAGVSLTAAAAAAGVSLSAAAAAAAGVSLSAAAAAAAEVSPTAAALALAAAASDYRPVSLCVSLLCLSLSDAEDAVFPQVETGSRPLDFRSEALPLAGLVGRHQRKTFSQDEQLEFVSFFNCLPGKTEGPQVRAAREALREREEALAFADMQQADAQANSNSSSSSSSSAAAAEDGCAMEAEDAASEALAALKRQRPPVLVDGLKQRQTRRPKGRFRPKAK
ncbi:hypothetical protein Emag_001331 [Eimeria magna]